MKAVWRGHVIARSDVTLEVDGYRYFPRDSVLMGRLEAAAQTPDDLHCPHGVQFYDIVDGENRSARAAWSYEAPQPSLRHVDQWIGFWRDVTVE